MKFQTEENEDKITSPFKGDFSSYYENRILKLKFICKQQNINKKY